MKSLVVPRLLSAVAALAALAGMPAASVAGEEPSPPRRTLSLSGHGEVTARPDVVIIRLGVENQQKTARKALAENTRAMTGVFSALKGRWKIADKDMMTSNFSIQPIYQYNKKMAGYSSPPKLVGYRVSSMLTVKVRDMDNAGAILDEVVRSGANKVMGISWSIDKPAPLRDEARRKAVRDALRKARIYAGEAGFSLGPVVRFSESGGFVQPRPVMMRTRAKMMAADAAPAPLAAGEQSISVNVSITWEIR